MKPRAFAFGFFDWRLAGDVLVLGVAELTSYQQGNK
jgi:hypothetical protein